MRLLLTYVLLTFALCSQLLGQGMALMRPGDVFEMRLGGVDPSFAQDFNSQYTVSQEGTVNIPLIKEVRAVGLTPPQLQTIIQNKLMEGKYFTTPTVNINLMQSLRAVTVGGSVRAPGRQPWSNDMTLSSAISAAGNLSEWGSKKGIRLIREGKVQYYDLRKIEKDPGLDPRLLPGDQVIVPGD